MSDFAIRDAAPDDVPAVLPIGRRNMLIAAKNVHGLKNHSQFWSIRFDGVWKA